MTRSPERLSKLLRQNQLRMRAKELIQQWKAYGVTASPVAHTRHWKLIDRLRGGRSWPLERVDDLAASVERFVGKSDLITIMGWNVEEEPPLLVSTLALLRGMQSVVAIYPDGFVLVDDESHAALLVDLDAEEGAHASEIDLPA